jgi:hypothetical protein
MITFGFGSDRQLRSPWACRPRPSSSRPLPRALPACPCLPHALGERLVEGAEEVGGVNRTGELVALDLFADRVLHFREDQRDIALVEPEVQLLQHVGGRCVDVCDGFSRDDEPPDVWALLGERSHGLTEHPRVGEDQRCVESVDNQPGQHFCVGIPLGVVQAGDPIDPTELYVVRPPRAAEDIEDGQATVDGAGTESLA